MAYAGFRCAVRDLDLHSEPPEGVRWKMPKYVINRRFEVGEDEMPEVGRRSRQIIEEEFPNVVWIHSHVTVEDDGRVRTFCLYEAPDMDAIQAHSELLGQHTIDGVFEVAGDVTPADFPPIPDA